MFAVHYFRAMKASFIVILWLMAAVTPGWAQDNVQTKLDRLLIDGFEKKVFSGNVLVIENEKPFYERSIGMSDYEASLPNSGETAFSTGSITKIFTRILVLQLIAESKLRFDDKLGKYLSGFKKEIAEKVTVRSLFDHQSGLLQYYDVPGFNPMERSVTSATDFLPWLRKEELAFEPGTQTEYSNSGYVALAAIIETIEKKNYAQVLQERIFNKIGMSKSGFQYKAENIPGKAHGYLSNQPGTLMDNTHFGLVGGGDGGIYSTLKDLTKFCESLMNDGRLLSDDSKVQLVNEPLFEKQFTSWDEFKQKGRMAIAGGGPGVSAVIALNMAKKRVVIVLSNFDGGTAETIFERIAAVLNGDEPAPLQPSVGIFLYNLLIEKGADYFTANVDTELSQNGFDLGDDDMPLMFAGEVLIRDEKADEAVALFTYYTQKFPQIIVAWNDLGEAYLMKDNKAKAKACFQKVLELQPNNPYAQERLEKL